MDAVTKIYPGVVANDCVSFAVRDGEIHALLGENGAGKTTLMRILYGMTSPDSGTIYWRGQPVNIGSSQDAIALGIGMVHQHFMLIPEFTVVENVVLGLRTARTPLLDLAGSARRLQEISAQYGLQVDPWAYVKDLSTGEQQRVEILKALYRGAHLLVLDEPTAVLTPGEVEELFVVLRGLRAQGHAVVLITHKLDEVMAISDNATVLRDGRVIATVSAVQMSKDELARLMVGRPVVFRIEKMTCCPQGGVIEIENVSLHTPDGRHEVADVDLTVCAGEIVALAGVAGNGQSALVDALFGLREPATGRITILGHDVASCRPRDLAVYNIGRIPEDRQTMALALGLSISENLVLETYFRPPYSRLGILRRPVIRRLAEQLRRDYDIRAPTLDVAVKNLSGGNQQKVVLAREMHREPRALIAFNPTRGLDVGATEFVFRQLLAARDRGVAILLVSTDLEEVHCLSDRIAVIYNGKIMGVVPAQDASDVLLGLMMTGTPLEELLAREQPAASSAA
jgi:ABC-type uncharacterized transport system ATPase subunit